MFLIFIAGNPTDMYLVFTIFRVTKGLFYLSLSDFLKMIDDLKF